MNIERYSSISPRQASREVSIAAPEVETTEDLPGLQEIAAILSGSRKAIVAAAVIGALLGFGISLLQKPKYEADTSLEVQQPNADFMNSRALEPGAQAAGGSVDRYLDTQAEILQSRALIGSVLASVPDSAVEPNTRGLSAVGTKVRELIAGLTSRGRPANPPDAAAPATQAAIDTALKNLTVATSNTSQVIKISYLSGDPENAAQFVNTLAKQYLESNRNARWTASKQTAEWLYQHTTELRRELAGLERELEAYSHSTGLMLTSDKENVQEAKLRDLQTELTKAQTERVARQSLYELSRSAEPGTLNDVINDPGLAGLEARLSDLQRQQADLLTIYMPKNSRVERVRAQLAETKAALARGKATIVARIKNDYDSALRREQMLANDFKKQGGLVSDESSRVAHFNMLKHEVESRRGVYDGMLRQVQEAAVVSTIHADTARIIDAAVPPTFPAKPRLGLNTLAGGVSGLIGMMFYLFIRERTNSRLRGPEEVRRALQVSELGVIPSVRLLEGGKFETALDMERTGGLTKLFRSTPKTQPVLELETWNEKPSPLSESFRSAVTSLQVVKERTEVDKKIFVVTSPGPMEGKTTVLTNLGIAKAEMGSRVLLVDCDIRRPRLHKIFDVPNRWGLSGLLKSDADLDAYPLEGLVCRTKIPGLFVVPSGPAVSSISHLWNSTRAKTLLRRLANEYDVVLVDTPPLLAFSDARLLGRYADGVIFVVRSNRTLRDCALSAMERLTNDGLEVAGTILNDWQPRSRKADARYYGYAAYRT